jgi:AraC family transcriptional regulator of adaptative response / DNA-3-methyladenine glycosylase II
MDRKMRQRDATVCGIFVVAVHTTGIYCLPSCPARKPLAENVSFLADEKEALAAGFRPCKRCRPDQYYLGLEPSLDRLTRMARLWADQPRQLESTLEMAKQLDCSVSGLKAAFKRHVQHPPASWLAARKLECACEVLQAGGNSLEAADACGLSLSALYRRLGRSMGLNPGQLAQLGQMDHWTVRLPSDYDWASFLAYQGRDPRSPTERVLDGRLRRVLRTAEGIWLLELQRMGEAVRVQVLQAPDSRRSALLVHAALVRYLGLSSVPAGLERRLSSQSLISPKRRGMRLYLTPAPFEALVWAILGQQVHLNFAFTLRGRLIETFCQRAQDGLLAHPEPEELAACALPTLRSLQISRAKAEALRAAGEAFARFPRHFALLGSTPYSHAREELKALRGVGEWTAQYVLMRGYGFPDCVPLQDAALKRAVQAHLRLERPPSVAQIEHFLAPFSPHRSLAVFHLWANLQDRPL